MISIESNRNHRKMIKNPEKAAGTVGFREIETTVFDPASVFLSTH